MRGPIKLTLPSLPSAALLAAVADLEAVERNKKYVIDMGNWHIPINNMSHYVDEKIAQAKPNAKCAVCFAGAVMANAVPIGKRVDWSEFAWPTNVRLDALDDFRSGRVAAALHRWGYDDDFVCSVLPSALHDVSVTPYETKPDKFKRDMRKLAGKLKEIGL